MSTGTNNPMNRCIAILPFAFMAHNIEEAISLEKVSVPIFNLHIANQPRFVIAVSLFTILGFIVVFWKKLYREPRQYQYAITGFAGMLFLNAFFPHVLSLIYFGTYTPGVITAALLILPLTGCILWKTYDLKIFSNRQLITTIISGGITGIVLVAVFLGIGYLLT